MNVRPTPENIIRLPRIIEVVIGSFRQMAPPKIPNIGTSKTIGMILFIASVFIKWPQILWAIIRPKITVYKSEVIWDKDAVFKLANWLVSKSIDKIKCIIKLNNDNQAIKPSGEGDWNFLSKIQ